MHDVKAVKEFPSIIPDSIYCIGKGYIDFERLYYWGFLRNPREKKYGLQDF